jgi:hypothetical protein
MIFNLKIMKNKFIKKLNKDKKVLNNTFCNLINNNTLNVRRIYSEFETKNSEFLSKKFDSLLINTTKILKNTNNEIDIRNNIKANNNNSLSLFIIYKYLFLGKKIYREKWKEDYSTKYDLLYLDKETGIIRIENSNTKETIENFILTNEDINTNDWKIYGEENIDLSEINPYKTDLSLLFLK